MKRKHFAITGCGTAGLASAIFLARTGHRVSLFERFQEPAPTGAGILLQPTGLAVLAKLGVLEPVLATGARIEALDGHANGKHIMDVRYSALVPDAYGLGVHRGNLFNALYAEALAAGAELHCNCDVADIRQRDDKAEIFLNDGTELGGFDAAIIANGTRSALREKLSIPQACTEYPWGALWAICRVPDAALPPVLQQRYDKASVMIGILPTGLDPVAKENCASFFWSLKLDDYSAWRDGDFSVWQEQVLSYWPQSEFMVSRLRGHEDLALASYADVVMKRWHDGRTVIIGDAAHGMSPQLGQGANLALLDAMVLNDCIRQAEDIPAAFTEYSRRRRRHLRFYQFASRWLTPMFQSQSRVAAWLRDISFPAMNRIPMTRREAVRTVAGMKTGWLFDKSVL